MPNFDGTGPRGMGPMTGRGQGYCVLSDRPRNGISGYQGLAGRTVPAPGQPFALFNKAPRSFFGYPYQQRYGYGFRNSVFSQGVFRRYRNFW